METASLRRMLVCGTCSWLIWATPSDARFLQADPVGYQDQSNLYAYVGNDPINGVDPTGECATVNDQRVGICGKTDEAQGYIDGRIADSNSAIRDVEALAIGKTQRIDFSFATRAPDARVGGRETDIVGGRTNITDLSDGTKIIEVFINRDDQVTARGEDRMGRTQERELNTEEKSEHELGTHVRNELVEPAQRLTGPAAVDPDNRYRRNAGINFRRTSHDTDLLRRRRSNR